MSFEAGSVSGSSTVSNALNCRRQHPSKAETYQCVAEIAELSPRRLKCCCSDAHNYSDADIAKLLGTSRGSVAMRLFERESVKNSCGIQWETD
jgi:hypothetical protein